MSARENLLRAAQILDEMDLPGELKFDYETFGDSENPLEPNYCGTSACALGALAIRGDFGLQCNWVQSIYNDRFYLKFGPDPEQDINPFQYAADKMGITRANAEYLFSLVRNEDNPYRPPTAHHVANAMRRVAELHHAG